ncbi:alkaline phosphatase PhoX [Candidatus Halobonum tyrrellensis]|uniref:Putative cell surface protein n=1 Tax=Candidatus Halobonum tyrrellensis G22 TaxID=1324957 RepID=V4HA75_9EURY|nr:alkaline phosphatase PhoX [Candidatus Halobonum tyrrellensis]ESP86953.1 putative cell surface protein [Candidatus Halobonum tyrrellensis G22]
MVDLNRRNLMASSVAAALGASVAGVASAEEVPESDTAGAPSVKGSLKRFSTTAFGAEVTGPFVFEDGSLLYSLQHPSAENGEPFGRAAVGYFSGFQFQFDGSNEDFTEVDIPETREEQGDVRAVDSEYEVLFYGRQPIRDGSALLGVTRTPDGRNIINRDDSGAVGADSAGADTYFAGTQYGLAASNPDCNQFVPTNDDGTEGYLFTNWENSPGNVSRVPISRDDDGEWSADLENASNLVNTDAFRDIGGTRINCYGDLSPWDTMISAEENYAHPRVNLTHTVGEIVEAESGVGLVGGCQFWNRPNPTEIGPAIETYAESGDVAEAFGPQGYWALDGVEFLAYYLGADPADQDGEENLATTPIDDVYPNPYRYGYFVDIRDPAADPPTPMKYWVMGRASWEAPDIQGDRKTVYGCSDGDSKGVYKFVADAPIDSYDDTDDIAGTLYAPKITNDAANAAESGSRNSPAQTPLEIEWMELGHATNGEVESWIAEYDDITQADYLDAHADTDWEADPEAALKEADLEVIENGNRNYISNEDILAWAEQYEQHGPGGVDEDLRRVPFLETRAAAKEIGASIEFNKAEGVDSVDDSEPGDFVYFGISEFNDDLANDTGDVQMDRVDGGVVYRAELEPDYDVSRLDPVIVGPDFTDSPGAADGALRNIDNVYAMRDGRVLCCEDGFGGPARSYPNDCLYVYQPNVTVDVASMAVAQGKTASVPVEATSLPSGVSGATLTVGVSDPDVATIEGVEFADELGLTERSVSSDGSTATLRFADTEKGVQPGGRNVELASLTVRADATGTTDLTVDVERMDDESGESLDAEGLSGVFVAGPSNVGGDDGTAPEDLDNDGLYEDLNGNGRLDYQDVEILFENFDSESVRMNESAYDFNENGQLDYDDVVSLYEEVN